MKTLGHGVAQNKQVLLRKGKNFGHKSSGQVKSWTAQMKNGESGIERGAERAAEQRRTGRTEGNLRVRVWQEKKMPPISTENIFVLSKLKYDRWLEGGHSRKKVNIRVSWLLPDAFVSTTDIPCLPLIQTHRNDFTTDRTCLWPLLVLRWKRSWWPLFHLRSSERTATSDSNET